MLFLFIFSCTQFASKLINEPLDSDEFLMGFFLDLDFDGRHKCSQKSSERFHWNDGTTRDNYQQVTRDL